MAEVGVARPGGDNQVIVGHVEAGKFDEALGEVEVLYLTEENFDVLAAANDPADGSCNFTGGKPGGRDLIEQRLEGVKVPAVDQRDLNRQTGEMQRGLKATEASADDHNSRLRVRSHVRCG